MPCWRICEDLYSHGLCHLCILGMHIGGWDSALGIGLGDIYGLIFLLGLPLQ